MTTMPNLRESHMSERLYSHDAEASVIGCLLLDQSLMAECLLEQGNFNSQPHQRIFAACQAMFLRKAPIDLLTLQDELGRREQLDLVGGLAYLVEIAKKEGADAIAHGCTGKGNDQVRFELGAYALKPGVKVIAPWREWDLLSREKLLAYAETNGIPIDMKHRNGGSPYSMDANLLHISFEGRHLEDPAAEAEESMWRWTVSPEQAPDAAEYLDVEFAKGDIVALNGVAMSPAQVLTKLNELGGKHGIGRLDLVENRYVGMKSRGCYETPGGTIILKAHRAIESITLDREVAHLKDDLMPRYASMIYNGYWWSPERLALQALIDHTQQTVNGWVRLKLYKGNVIVVGRDSKTDSLFDPTIATFEDDAGAYDQRDAGGFIKLNALRMRIAANLKAKKG